MVTQERPSLKEYYLWKKEGETRYPWQRQFVNWDFLKYERKRINELSEWKNKFNKADNNSYLDTASFYTVPLELPSSWKAAIADYGNYNYSGLSALFNSPQALVVALIPYTIKQPQEYRLIDITQSKRVNIINRRLNVVWPALIIESWNYLKSDYIYVDVPYEKKIVCNIFKENLIDDEQISLSFQSPIISAPYVDGSIGGISLSSISGNSEFAKELVKIIQLMVPPEYRASKPPEAVFKGHKFQYSDGIEFHLAERPYFDQNVLSSLYTKQYNILDRELFRRYKFHGEFSIFSTLNPDEGNVTQIWKELLKNFTATEVTLGMDELPEADVDLMPLKNAINEDLWIQIVHSRQYMPSINTDTDKEFIKIINLLKEDFDTLLSDINEDEKSREFLVRSMLHQSKYNLLRITQSFARADEKDQLDGAYLKKARDLLVDNFKGFTDHPRIRKFKMRMEGKKENARYSVVQTELINHQLSTTSEIFESVKSMDLFKDIYDLQNFIDNWLHKKGYVIIDSNKRYSWVGL